MAEWSEVARAAMEALRARLVDDICDVITTHQLLDGGAYCAMCKAPLYGPEHSMTLSRHRAEKIAEMLLTKYIEDT